MERHKKDPNWSKDDKIPEVKNTPNRINSKLGISQTSWIWRHSNRNYAKKKKPLKSNTPSVSCGAASYSLIYV